MDEAEYSRLMVVINNKITRHYHYSYQRRCDRS